MSVPWADLSPHLRSDMQDAVGETNGKPMVFYIYMLTKPCGTPLSPVLPSLSQITFCPINSGGFTSEQDTQSQQQIDEMELQSFEK